MNVMKIMIEFKELYFCTEECFFNKDFILDLFFESQLYRENKCSINWFFPQMTVMARDG